MRKLGLLLFLGGAVLAISDYLITNGANPPGTFGSILVNVDDLNGLLSGVAPAIGVGTLFAATGVYLVVMG